MGRISRRKFVQSAVMSGAALASSRARGARPAGVHEGDVAWDGYRLFFERPAPTWPEALPVGNGRLGAMVFGEPEVERIQLNEESIWEGERRDRDNPRAGTAVPEIRKLLFAGKVHEAEAMAMADMMSIPQRMPCYQTLGDLHLTFGSKSGGEVSAYRLELSLDQAIVTTTFERDRVRYVREVFSSAPDQVIVIRLTASKPGMISFVATMDRPGNHATTAVDAHTLEMTGEALPVHDNPGLPVKERQVGIRFLSRMRVVAEGGEVHADRDATAPALTVAGANAVTLLIDCATIFRFPAGEDAMRAAVEGHLQAASNRSYAELRMRHVADHRAIFRRASLELGSDANRDTPTDVRVQRMKAGAEDIGLLPIYFQFGRYLLISSSRPGTLAANLQGIWNDSVDPPWGSKYTVNINAEMNYWIAERTSLADCHTPFFDLLDRTRPAAMRVAKSYYRADGCVVHHNTDIWGDAGPIDGLGGGIWPMGFAWMATQLWDSYQYRGDITFLRERAYPRLRESAMFLLDYLTPSPEGYLVTGPSCSPENAYLLPDGTKANLCMAPTMDIEIVRATFKQATEAAKILGVDTALVERMGAAAAKLPPYKIGRYGQLQEWQQDYMETEPGHRHISHLWALYPNDGITLRGTPDLAEACHVA